MINQDNTAGWPLDMHQLKWALRHGQKIDGLDNMVLTSQSAVQKGDNMDNNMKRDSNAENISLYNTVFKEQIDKLGQSLNKEILSLRNEVATFVQTQLNQDKAVSIAEIEWENILENRETKFQADMRDMQQSIFGKIEEHFQYVDEHLQLNDKTLKQEVALLVSQFAELQKSQDNKGQEITNDWQRKMEERQTQLVENVNYIQYVVEEIATRPQSIEAQEKLREKFFMREIAALKVELASACQAWRSMNNGRIMANDEKDSNSVEQDEINLSSEVQTRLYEKKRKRRH